MVERGLAVVRVYDGLESHWWAIAYPNFAVGAVPIMCILHRAKGSDVADSHVATESASVANISDVVWLETPPIMDERAWWCECMDALGDLSRTAEWHMQLHRVTSAITPSNPPSRTTTRLTALPMGESKQWWWGSRSVESAAKEPTPDLQLVPEDEREEDVNDEAHDEEDEDVGDEVYDDTAALRFRALPDDMGDDDHELLSAHAPARLARECKNARNGTRVSCVGCRAAGREVLTYLLTYKKRTSHRKASYQITCDYHEPDVMVKQTLIERNLAYTHTHTYNHEGDGDVQFMSARTKPTAAPLAGPGAAIVLEGRYQTWDGLLARHDGDAQKAKLEFDACMAVGYWEQHAGVLFVMVDCVTKPQPAAAA